MRHAQSVQFNGKCFPLMFLSFNFSRRALGILHEAFRWNWCVSVCELSVRLSVFIFSSFRLKQNESTTNWIAAWRWQPFLLERERRAYPVSRLSLIFNVKCDCGRTLGCNERNIKTLHNWNSTITYRTHRHRHAERNPCEWRGNW